MDEIGLTNNELLTIVKEASKNSGLSFERILEALVRTEDTGALHPDDFWIRNLLWKPILREHFFEEIDPQLLMTNRKKAENLEQLAKIKADRKKGKK